MVSEWIFQRGEISGTLDLHREGETLRDFEHYLKSNSMSCFIPLRPKMPECMASIYFSLLCTSVSSLWF